MSFIRNKEIYRSDYPLSIKDKKIYRSVILALTKGESAEAGSPDHRLEVGFQLLRHESPAGYSLAGWSPPEPASASPTGFQYRLESPFPSSDFSRTAKYKNHNRKETQSCVSLFRPSRPILGLENADK